MSAPWLDDGDIALYHGDALAVLRSLPAGIAQTCVTSPPYWGLRDYGTGSWTGGDPEHEHDTEAHRNGRGGSGAPGKQTAGAFPSETAAQVCSCGARRVDDQLGLEASPDQYVERLVAVMREVWRVLRADGTLWLNLGDSYATTPTGNRGTKSSLNGAEGERYAATLDKYTEAKTQRAAIPQGLKAKDLVGVPWRVAFALQADGWYLRSDIIWAKPNPMPESVTDRPTKAHEYVFLLAKQPRYYMDMDAIRECREPDSLRRSELYGANPSESKWNPDRNDGGRGGSMGFGGNPAGRNARSVWEVATQPTPEAHFATYPEALVRRCIQAGTSERGGCAECGAPWVRQTEPSSEYAAKLGKGQIYRYVKDGPSGPGIRTGSESNRSVTPEYQTTGWVASCQCGAPPVAQTALDPFVGSGTTALVARKHGRRCIGIDLSLEYLAIAARRTQQLSLLGEAEALEHVSLRGGGAARRDPGIPGSAA